MTAALIPYIVTPEKRVDLPLFGEVPLSVFGLVVVVGVLVGVERAIKYARTKDLDEGMARDEIFWVLVFGFIISHFISVIFYFPERLRENPWVLLMVWNGLSSVGGFFGSFIGMHWWMRRHRQPVLIYADVNIWGLLIGMCFGRLGCALIHDHPGRIVDAGTFLAVGPWPCRCPEGPSLPSCCHVSQEIFRYDLGLIEFVCLLALTLYIYFIFDWRKAAPGRITGIVAAAYGLTRFGLDFFRETEAGRGVATPDLRYFGLTPAQYFSVAFALMGLWLLFVRKPKPEDLAYAKESEHLAAQGKQSESSN